MVRVNRNNTHSW